MKTLRNFRYWVIAAGLMLCTVEPMEPDELNTPSALFRGTRTAEKEDAGERAADDPAPEHKGDIAARESLEPKGVQNGLTAGRDPQPWHDRNMRDFAAWMLCRQKRPASADWWCI